MEEVNENDEQDYDGKLCILTKSIIPIR